MNTCPYFCLNKTDLGYCKTTVCINPKYNCLSVTKWLDKADYVQVVRCKDCKWWKTNYMWNGRECKVCVVDPYEPVRKPDDYCSRGERKDDE